MRRIKAVTSHAFQALLEGALVATLLVGLVAGTAFAAKPSGGGGGTSSLTPLVMVRDANSNLQPNYMDDITFTVSTTATKTPFVGLRCYQGTNFVLDGYVGYFPSYLFNRWFTLGSGYWDPALATTCNARLFYYDGRGREHVLNTLNFDVAP